MDSPDRARDGGSTILVRDASPDIRAACPDREGCVPGRSSWPSGEMPTVHAGRSGAEAAKRRRGGYSGAPVGPVVRATRSTLPGKTHDRDHLPRRPRPPARSAGGALPRERLVFCREGRGAPRGDARLALRGHGLGGGPAGRAGQYALRRAPSRLLPPPAGAPRLPPPWDRRGDPAPAATPVRGPPHAHPGR